MSASRNLVWLVRNDYERILNCKCPKANVVLDKSVAVRNQQTQKSDYHLTEPEVYFQSAIMGYIVLTTFCLLQ